MTSNSLKARTYSGVAWSFVEATGFRMVQFCIGIVLARLLLPEQFGLIGIMAIFLGIAQTLLDGGFSSALIQKQEINEADTSSVFFLNIFTGVALAATLSLSAPLIAAFYAEPELSAIARTMSLVFVLNSFAGVHWTVLTRNLDFKTQTKVSLAGVVGSGLIGIWMALEGFGVWSLVAQQLTGAFLRAVFLWICNEWRPKLIFSFQALSDMFRFGSRLLGSGLLHQVFENSYYLVIGKIYGVHALGLYSRARTLADIPSVTLSEVITRVSFPVFSAIQNDDVRLKRALRSALGVSFLTNTPVMVGIAVVAEPLVRLVLTEKWLPCVPYLRLLCVVGLTLPLHTLNLSVLKAKGRSDLFLRLELVKKALLILILAIVWQWGIMAIICGQIALSFLGFFINSYYTGRLIGYGAIAQLRDVSVYVTLSLIMGTTAHSAVYLGPIHNTLLLFLQLTLGVAVYLLLCAVLRPPAVSEARDALSQWLSPPRLRSSSSIGA